jgi:hypothetical protein
MTLVFQALSSELLKLRRTPFLPVAIIFPSLVGVVQTLLMLQQPSRLGALGYGRFTFYMRQSAVSTWALLLLGMFVTVEVVLLAGVDHDGEHWKYLFARAVPRWSIYLAKLLLAMGAVALGSIVLGAVLYLIGHLLYTSPPTETNGIPPIIWSDIAYSIARVFLASWGLVALLLWICVRVASPVVPATVGLIGTAAGILLPLGPTYVWVRADPWLMPFFAQNLETVPLLLGMGTGVLLTILGCIDVTRRDVL